MSKARVIITAVILEGRSQAQVARDYNVSQAWVSRLVARYRAEGDAAFEPRSRRPDTHPQATPSATVELILKLRRELVAKGLDAGADTIRWHLQHHHRIAVSRATIYRTIRRANLVTPAPAKRPKSSYIRFQAEQPNETWQADFTHWTLADGSDAEILTWLDDHARYALSVTCHQTRHRRHRGHHVPSRYQRLWGSVLHTDGQRLGLHHPFRPHRSLPSRATPAVAYQTRPKAVPDGTSPDSEFRVRHDRVSSGSVTLRVDGNLHHIGLGHPLNGTPIIMLIHGYNIRVIHAATGEVLRRLTINPERRYHGTGKPIGGPSAPIRPLRPTKKQETRTPIRVRALPMSRDITTAGCSRICSDLRESGTAGG